MLSKAGHTTVVDAEKLLNTRVSEYALLETGNFEASVQSMFNEMVLRNNTYKEAGMNVASLDNFDEKTYVIVGLKHFYELLSNDGKEKFRLLIEKAESIYKVHFMLVETVSQFNNFNYESWYKKQITGSDGLFIGDGVAEQYMLKVSKVTSELYQEVGSEYGYLFIRNRSTLIKLIASKDDEGGM